MSPVWDYLNLIFDGCTMSSHLWFNTCATVYSSTVAHCQPADSNVKLNSEVGMKILFIYLFIFAQSVTKTWYPQIVTITAQHAVAPALFSVSSYYTFFRSSIKLTASAYLQNICCCLACVICKFRHFFNIPVLRFKCNCCIIVRRNFIDFNNFNCFEHFKGQIN